MTRMHGCLALTIVGMASAWLVAQPPQPPLKPPANPPPAPQPDPKLDGILARWEKEMSGVTTLALDVTCERENPVFKKKEELSGYAKFMRQANSDYLAALKLENPRDPSKYERYVMTGSAIYSFLPAEQVITQYTIPPRQAGQPPDDGPLAFLFAMKAETLKRRFQLSLSTKYKETDWYVYLDVTPKFARDQADFTEARIAILKQDTKALARDMPRELYLVEPNGTQVKYTITRLQRNVPGSVDRLEFQKPELPQGWHWKTDVAANQPAPKQPPSVVRPQNPK